MSTKPGIKHLYSHQIPSSRPLVLTIPRTSRISKCPTWIQKGMVPVVAYGLLHNCLNRHFVLHCLFFHSFLLIILMIPDSSFSCYELITITHVFFLSFLLCSGLVRLFSHLLSHRFFFSYLSLLFQLLSPHALLYFPIFFIFSPVIYMYSLALIPPCPLSIHFI